MTLAAPTAPAVTPDVLHQLARTAEAAGWGPDGPMPAWLDKVAADLVAAAGRLRLMARDARAHTGGALVGAGGK